MSDETTNAEGVTNQDIMRELATLRLAVDQLAALVVNQAPVIEAAAGRRFSTTPPCGCHLGAPVFGTGWPHHYGNAPGPQAPRETPRGVQTGNEPAKG